LLTTTASHTFCCSSSPGNDCFLRNPFNIDENLFVDISSPSSSRYNSVTDLGTPEEAGKTLLEQLLNKVGGGEQGRAGS
jgi:hypothetical protein